MDPIVVYIYIYFLNSRDKFRKKKKIKRVKRELVDLRGSNLRN